jgi:hypothetical protein
MEKQNCILGKFMSRKWITPMKKNIEVPASILKELKLKEGDIIEIQISKLYIEDSLKKEIA